MFKLKHIIKWAVNKCGFEVIKKPSIPPYSWLANEGIKTVLDIGANKGQFAMRIHKLLPDAEIFCFEPLSDCYEALKKQTKHNAKFRCFNYALGNEDGKQIIYHNEYSDSSSILPMEQLHIEAFPFTKNSKQEYIEIHKLDSISNSLKLNKNILIKIDVQGFEYQVIMGGAKTLNDASILIIETCFEPLYKGQMIFDDIYSIIRKSGFSFKGIEEAFQNPLNGSILYCDSIFRK